MDSQCPDQYKDMFEASLVGESQIAGAEPPRSLRGPTTACIYKVVPDAQGERIGQLGRVVEISGTTLTSFNNELARAVSDSTCAVDQLTTFAVVDGGNDRGVAVAVDGSAVNQNGYYWRASAGLRALLTSRGVAAFEVAP